ncbi:unnamed protein product [Allacma fusca]|uniref:Uncharacterized protein n=1 Tax=Allacma fusca TaxID=39272 RepID=A0A8J2KUR9_9HEXA|nr:unnamed protein product [Allacma fusca]
MEKLVKLIDMQCEPGKQTKSAAFVQYLELEINAFSGDDEEDFIDACVDKLREIKKRRKQRKQAAELPYRFEYVNT